VMARLSRRKWLLTAQRSHLPLCLLAAVIRMPTALAPSTASESEGHSGPSPSLPLRRHHGSGAGKLRLPEPFPTPSTWGHPTPAVLASSSRPGPPPPISKPARVQGVDKASPRISSAVRVPEMPPPRRGADRGVVIAASGADETLVRQAVLPPTPSPLIQLPRRRQAVDHH
jgi:hypothetical protein